jgi:hypothetical protein
MSAKPFLRGAALAIVVMLACGASDPAVNPADDAVVVTAIRNPVDKSYRKMVRGMDVFEQKKSLAPNAALRFKLLPRRPDTKMSDIDVQIVGDSFADPVEVAPDHTFTLARERKALREDASVRPNRKAKTMTWRAEVRTPGIPQNTRRLGDLRLECHVGMEADLISNYRSAIGFIAGLITSTMDYCNTSGNRYLFFAERPIFGVTLAHGARREALPVDRMYGGASADPGWKKELSYCDCEVLLDRAYFLPLGDQSWPDDTLVEFDFMDDGNAGTHALSR